MPSMGKPSRDKGKVGERQVVELAKPYFPDAHRSWQTPQPNGDIGGIPGVHLEVRRREALSVEAWCKEVEAKCECEACCGTGKVMGDHANDHYACPGCEGSGVSRIPIVAWRRNGQPWRVALPLDQFLQLLQRGHDAR
jgi:hypothetical protein